MKIRKARKKPTRTRVITQEKELISRVTNDFRFRGTYSENQIRAAVSIHQQSGIALPLSLEIIGRELSIRGLQEKGMLPFVKALKDEYPIKTKHGNFIVSPSFFTRTGRSELNKGFYGLNNFSWMAFRVLPAPQEAELYNDRLGHMTKKDPYKSAIIVEIGVASIGKRKVVVVTNAQATKDYYSLPWKLKRRFKGVYEKTLQVIQETAKVPLLIPTNAEVKKYLKQALGHTISDKVLDEFYDGFCQHRNRKKIVVEIKNPNDNQKIKSEFWH